jgi:hypothetical protein
MRTNRDFYLFVERQLQTRRGQTRSLERYLLTLRSLLEPYGGRICHPTIFSNRSSNGWSSPLGVTQSWQ